MTEQLLEHGDRIAGTVRKMDAMNDLKAKYGDRLWLAHLDVSDTPTIREVVNNAFADLGKIDVVVNNAGYGLFGPAESLTDEQIAYQINTNLLGSIQACGSSASTGARRRSHHPTFHLWWPVRWAW
jgi:NAD(P)-dependent dehydrogenase (short-subunit alcohol dehydrogenase family)